MLLTSTKLLPFEQLSREYPSAWRSFPLPIFQDVLVLFIVEDVKPEFNRVARSTIVFNQSFMRFFLFLPVFFNTLGARVEFVPRGKNRSGWTGPFDLAVLGGTSAWVSDSDERLRAYLSLSVRAFASTAEDWASSSLWFFSSLGTVSTIHRQKKADLGRKYHYRSFKMHRSFSSGVSCCQPLILTSTKLFQDECGQWNGKCSPRSRHGIFSLRILDICDHQIQQLFNRVCLGWWHDCRKEIHEVDE